MIGLHRLPGASGQCRGEGSWHVDYPVSPKSGDEVQLGVERLLLGVIQVKRNYARYGNVTVFPVAKLKHSDSSGGHQGGDLGVVDIGLSPYSISSSVSVIESSRLPVLKPDRVDHANA